jgi:hypothetical protein
MPGTRPGMTVLESAAVVYQVSGALSNPPGRR